MSLIEELGGYEKAKDIVNKSPCKSYTYHNHPYQKGYIRCYRCDNNEYFCVSDIDDALLEYRKANSIFEDGDMVIDGLLGNQVIMYQDSYKFLGNGYVSHFVRHATPEEIKVGHRL